jgi:hypothetical protein
MCCYLHTHWLLCTCCDCCQVGDHSMDLYLAALEDALRAQDGMLTS